MRKRFRPSLEALEDRLAPAGVFHWLGNSGDVANPDNWERQSGTGLVPQTFYDRMVFTGARPWGPVFPVAAPQSPWVVGAMHFHADYSAGNGPELWLPNQAGGGVAGVVTYELWVEAGMSGTFSLGAGSHLTLAGGLDNPDGGDDLNGSVWGGETSGLSVEGDGRVNVTGGAALTFESGAVSFDGVLVYVGSPTQLQSMILVKGDPGAVHGGAEVTVKDLDVEVMAGGTLRVEEGGAVLDGGSAAAGSVAVMSADTSRPAYLVGADRAEEGADTALLEMNVLVQGPAALLRVKDRAHLELRGQGSEEIGWGGSSVWILDAWLDLGQADAGPSHQDGTRLSATDNPGLGGLSGGFLLVQSSTVRGFTTSYAVEAREVWLSGTAGAPSSWVLLDWQTAQAGFAGKTPTADLLVSEGAHFEHARLSVAVKADEGVSCLLKVGGASGQLSLGDDVDAIFRGIGTPAGGAPAVGVNWVEAATLVGDVDGAWGTETLAALFLFVDVHRDPDGPDWWYMVYDGGGM